MWGVNTQLCNSNNQVITKDDIYDEIERSVSEGNSLELTKTLVESKFAHKLGDYDNYRIEEKFVDLLTSHLLEKVPQEIIKSIDINNVIEFTNKLQTIKSLDECCNFFSEFCYVNNESRQLYALKTLCGTSSLVKANERNYLLQFKQECFTLVHSKADYINGELCFNKCLIDLLKNSKNPDKLCETLGLLPEIINDIENDSCFKDFLNKLLHKNVNLQDYKLQQAIRLIVNQDKFVLNKDIKKTIESYLKKTVLREKQVDGRLVLEVEGRHIVVSKVLKEIETKLRTSDLIEEIRFCNPDVVHVDKDLSASVWHGKNIVLYADTVVVSEDNPVIWDVSGKNAIQLSEIDTKDEITCFGSPGADGQNGESGGNILVMVDVIKNAHNFKIITVGGFGSNGQNGKVGLNGKDGNNLDGEIFKKLFPPVSKLLDSEKIKNLKITKNVVLDCFQSVEQFFYGNEFLVCPLTKIEFENYLSQCISQKQDFYFDLATDSGCKITFSFYYGPIEDACHSYLLRKGPPGEEGTPGGAGGQGGNGGFAGEVDICINQKLPFDLSVTRANGASGVPGKIGMTGIPGKNGVDRAYADYSRKRNWPKYFIPDVEDDICLTIQYSSKETSENVWSPHNDSYASIVPRKNEYKISDKITHETSVNKLHEAHVPCKKAISKESIRAQYEQDASFTDLGKLISILDYIKTVIMEFLNKATMETEQLTTEVKVMRSVNYSFDETENISSYNDATCSETMEESQYEITTNLSSNELVESIKSNPTVLQNWLHLFKIRLNLSQLQDLWNILNNISLDENLNQTVKVGFCNKYQLAILQNLAESFDNPHNTQSSSIDSLNSLDFGLHCFNSHLVIKNNDQEPLSEIEEYFLKNSSDNREEALNKFKSEFFSIQNNRQTLDLLMSFFEEHSAHPLVVKKLQDVSEFEEDKAEKLRIKFDSFKSALIRSKNNQLYKYLIKSIVEVDNRAKVSFENAILKDILLNLLYKMYIKAVKTQFDWESLFTGNEGNIILKEMFTTFKEKGPFCALYREFLAYHYKKNIAIYSINERNETILVHNHNSTARTSLHFLIKDGAFVQLNVEKAMTELLVSHLNQGIFFNNVLTHIDSFVEKEQFDEFISEKPYLSEFYKGPEKSSSIHVRLTHISMEEANIKVISDAFIEDKERELVSCRLEKLRLEYTGCESILYYLALHFESESAHISGKELSFILNFTLKCALKKKQVLPLISWIVAAYPQTQWIGEIILLKIEFSYNKILDSSLKSKFRNYLSNQSNRCILMLLVVNVGEKNDKFNIEKLDKLLYLLCNIPQAHVGLDQLDFDDWIYYLQDKFWTHQLKPLTDWSEGQLKTASYHLVALENIVDTNMCIEFIEVLKTHKTELDSESGRNSLLNILRVLTDKEVCLNKGMLELLKNTNIYNWNDTIVETYCNSSQERRLRELVELMRYSFMSSLTDKTILNKLDNITEDIKCSDKIQNALNSTESRLFEERMQQQFDDSPLLENNDGNKMSLFENIKQYLQFPLTDKTFKSLGMYLINLYSKSSINNPHLLPKCTDNKMISFNVVFAVVVKAVEMKLSLEIRASQKLAIMIMLKSDKHLLSQVSTGEGKSLIIVIVSIIKALHGEKVDIITSSHVLAERDAKYYKGIYNLFGINVGDNCSENLEDRIKVYSDNIVVYGELANFQRDYLLHHIHGKNILGDRSYQTIIIDEVDSMLLDKGNNTLYLSHEIPGLDKLESVFVYIWISLNTHVVQTEVESSVLNLKNKILNEIYGLVTKKDLNSLDMRLNAEEIDRTFDHLVKEGIIRRNGTVHTTYIQWEQIPETYLKKNHLRYIFKKILERERLITFPNYLRKFVENHLETWIKSAFRAMSMEPGVDYVVDVDRSNKSYDRSPNITIIDRDTGTDLTNSQWEDGLHQFLQIKHGCKLSLISLKAVFISNVSYFKKYKTLLGLTGTLGSKIERDLLKEIYETEFVMIPTSKSKLFLEEEPIMCSSTDEWISTIYKQANNKIMEKRSVLIVCETMNDVMILKQKFDQIINSQDSYVSKILTYTRDFESQIVNKELDPGLVIISTNLAGRGTDLKLKADLINAGGLHVCLTFWPKNCRIEEQAFGRAARKGEPGSAQLVFKNVNQKTRTTSVIDLKKERNANEICRIIDIHNYYNNQTQPEEKGFTHFLEVYKEVDELSNHHTKIKPILLQICLDEWAFWLEENANCPDFELKTNSVLETLKSKLSGEDFIDHVKNPSQLIMLGLVLIDLKKHEQAISLFNRVIKEEPSFSESARYYRLCSLSVLKKLNKEDIFIELNLVAGQIRKRIQTLVISANTIDHIKQKNLANILQIESFKEQQMNNCKTYEVFLENIYNIIGQGFTYADFICPSIIDEESASKLYNDLLERNVISGPTVKSNLTDVDLDFVTQYGLLPEEISCILRDSRGGTLDDKKLIKQLKQSRCLPSRELFWKELVSKDLLLSEEKYSLVDLHGLKLVDPSLRSVIESLKVTNKLEDENEIWLYRPQEINCSEENLVLIEKDKLKEKIGENKYKILKSKYVIHLNKLATLLKPRYNIQLDYFDCLTKKDFQKVDISDDIAAEIICELKEKCIIKEISDCKYSLLINTREIESLKLSIFNAYSNDVINLLSNRFAFRVALEQTWHFMQTKSDYDFCLPLQIRLQKCIIEDLYEHEIIRKSLVNPKQENNIEKTLKKLYPKAMTKEQYYIILREIFNDIDIIENVVKNLIDKKWLIEFNDLPNSLKEMLTRSGDIFKFQKYIFRETDLEELSPLFKPESIELVLKRHLNLSNPEHQSFVKQFIYQHSSGIHDIETYNFSPCPLSEVLQQHNIPFRECTIFSINGFDRLLILEEMKYTTKMIVMTLGTVAFGISQIAVGAIFNMVGIVKEGVKDLIFSINCVISGHFNWKEYCLGKITSLLQSTWMLLNNLKTFASSFGEKAATFSWSSIKNIFSENVVREIIKYSSVACVTGVGYGAIDNILQPQLKQLGETLMEYSLADLYDIVDNHSAIETVKDIYLKFGRQQSKQLVEYNCSLISERCKNENDRDWAMVFNKIRSFINKDSITYFEEFKRKKTMSLMDYISLLRKVGNLIKAVVDIIKVCNTYAVELSAKPSEMTDNLKLSLQKCLNPESDSRIEKESEEAEKFTHEMINFWKKEIRSVYEINVERCIIHPLLCFIKNKSVTYLSNVTSKQVCMFIDEHDNIESNKIIEPISKIDEFHASVNKASRSEVQNSLLGAEYDECLTELFVVKQRASIFLEILKNSSTADSHFVELCCSVIPEVCKSLGLNLPSLKVVIENGSSHQTFGGAIGANNDELKLLIPHDINFLNNLKGNKILLANIFDTLYKSVSKLYPDFKVINGQNMRCILVNSIENDFPCQKFINDNYVRETGDNEEHYIGNLMTSKITFSRISAVERERYASQHSNVSREVHMDSAANINLNKNKIVTSFKKNRDCVLEGFKIALKKINHHLSLFQPHFKYFKLTLDDFDGTKHVVIPVLKFSGCYFNAYATNYELVIPLKEKKSSLLVDYKVTMSLISSYGKTQFRHHHFGPHGPHIMFEINPVNPYQSNYNMETNFRGHVLIDYECEDMFYSVEDCRSAGELAVILNRQ